MDNKPEDLSLKEEKEEIKFALLEAIYIFRTTESGEGIYAVLQVKEAEKMVDDIFIELSNIGYEIKKIQK